ncbi:hypothetical protein BDW72DRAFT_171054 [Aspergillus terricola var. indicus]
MKGGVAELTPESASQRRFLVANHNPSAAASARHPRPTAGTSSAGTSEEANGRVRHTDELENSGYLDFKPSKAVERGKWLWSSMLGRTRHMDRKLQGL